MPRILYLDFETTPIVGWTWRAWEGDMFHIMRDVQIMSVAWSWDDEDEVYCLSLPEFPGYKPGIMNVNDKRLVQAFVPIFDRADAVVAQNGKNFDFKVWRTRLLVHGLSPAPNLVELDTKQWANKFRFSRNSLDNMSRQLGGTRKMKTRKDLHYDCLELNDAEAWKENNEYNKVDVLVLKENAKKMAPHVPILSNFHSGVEIACRNPLCGSKFLRRNGIRKVTGGHKVEFICKKCFGYTRGPLVKDSALI